MHINSLGIRPWVQTFNLSLGFRGLRARFRDVRFMAGFTGHGVLEFRV